MYYNIFKDFECLSTYPQYLQNRAWCCRTVLGGFDSHVPPPCLAEIGNKNFATYFATFQTSLEKTFLDFPQQFNFLESIGSLETGKYLSF